MPRTKGKRKTKSSFSEVTRALKIIVGSAITVGMFFLVGYVVDFFAREESKSRSEKIFLPFDDNERTEAKHTHQEKASPESYPSFFETLLQKEDTEKQVDTRRSKELLEKVKPKYSPALKKNNKLNDLAINSQKPDTISSKKIYKIQIGSFQSAERAQAFSNKLKAKGFKPYIEKVLLPGKSTVYRVRIGKFKSKMEAQNMAKKIEYKEKISVLIVSR